MAYFDCIVGGSGKGNTLVVTCADELAGATITCTNGTKTYTKTCPSTAPYAVTFYGLMAGTWTVSATVSGDTYTTTVVITDYEAELGGFNWKTWVDLSENYTSSDFTDLDDLLSDETAVRELMTIHACVDYLADIATTSEDVETIIGNDLCAKWINNRDYALDTLYANEIIADLMDEADKYFYGEWVITDNTTTPPTWGAKGNVPVMTANNAPYGTAFASSVYSPYEPWKAFDNDETSIWASYTGTTNNEYLGYVFTNPIKVKKVHIRENGMIGTFQIMASNTPSDQSSYVAVSDVITGKGTAGASYDVVLDNDEYYLAYKLQILTHVSGSMYSYNIDTLQFYGRELSVSVPTMTGNTTPYGEAICGAVLSGATQQAWVSFDNVINSDGYETPNNAVSAGTAWLGYKFLDKTNVKMVTISNRTGYSGNDLHAFISGKLQGRNNDNEEWEDIETITRTNYSTVGITTAHIISNSGSYSQLRVKADTTLSNNDRLHIAELQFYGIDYSEKEFEIGATKKWIYDHGVEIETLEESTYEETSYWGRGSLVKGEHSFTITTPTTQYGCDSAVTTSPIDITPYSWYRAKIHNMSGSLGGSSDNRLFMMVNQNKANPNDNRMALFEPTDNKSLPNCMALSISSINQSVYLWAGRTLSNNQTVEYTELWLE